MKTAIDVEKREVEVPADHVKLNADLARPGDATGLAGDALSHVVAPCLFIVGGNDRVVLQLNRDAMARLPRDTMLRLEIIPGATHLFEEPSALDRVAYLACDWFRKRLKGPRNERDRLLTNL